MCVLCISRCSYSVFWLYEFNKKKKKTSVLYLIKLTNHSNVSGRYEGKLAIKCKADCASLLVWLTGALCFNNYSIIFKLRLFTAICNGPFPILSLILVTAPFLRSTFVNSEFYLRTLRCNGVCPSLSSMLMSPLGFISVVNILIPNEYVLQYKCTTIQVFAFHLFRRISLHILD